MKFELNSYKKSISKQDLIDDLLNVSKRINGSYLSRSTYEKYGKYSATPYIKNFGSWISALNVAGLRTDRNQNEYKIIDDKLLIDDAIRIGKILNQDTITTSEYKKHGYYRVQTVLSRFKSWNNFLTKAGLKPTDYKIVTDDDLFKEIARLWTEKGSQPTTTDIRNGKSIYSLNTYARHFGGFRNALEKFILYYSEKNKVNNDSDSDNEDKNDNSDLEIPNNIKKLTENPKTPSNKHITPRNINTTLRFKVLKRDNFKCCSCGASPAKNPNVELHVDHIIPWVKGGETTLDNLQTLCSTCNLGKRDLT